MANPRAKVAKVATGSKRQSTKAQMTKMKAMAGPTREFARAARLSKATPANKAAPGQVKKTLGLKSAASLAPGRTPKVSASSGRTVGSRTIKSADKMSAKLPTRAARGTNTYVKRPKGPAPTKKPGTNIVDEAGKWLDDNIPTRKFKWPNLPKGIFPLHEWAGKNKGK